MHSVTDKTVRRTQRQSEDDSIRWRCERVKSIYLILMFMVQRYRQHADLHSAPTAVLHHITDVFWLSTSSNERCYVVMIQLLQLHNQSAICSLNASDN